MTSAGGVWKPAQAISYGVAIGSFQPVEYVKPAHATETPTAENGEPLDEGVESNPHQVSARVREPWATRRAGGPDWLRPEQLRLS